MVCTLSDSTLVKTEFLMSTGGAAKRRELAARLDEHPGVWGLERTSARCGPKSDETRDGKKKGLNVNSSGTSHMLDDSVRQTNEKVHRKLREP